MLQLKLRLLLSAGAFVAAVGRRRFVDDSDLEARDDEQSGPAGLVSGFATPKRLGLTIENFGDILFSEADAEYGAGELTETETKLLWEAASAYEWSRAKEATEEKELAGRRSLNIFSTSVHEEQMSGSGANTGTSIFPFVVCDPDLFKSGWECKKHVASHFGEDLLAISNSENMTCFITSASASEADDTPPPLIVHPLMPEVKLQQGIVEEITQSDQFASRLFSLFCPSRSSSQEDAERIISEIVSSIGEETRSRFLRLEDASDAVNEVLRKTSRRRLLWSSDGESDRECAEFFLELTTAADPKGDSFTIDLSSAATSTACVLLLIERLSLRPEICSVGIVPDMHAMNQEAQWVVQSGVQDERPFFAKGITGEGEIVACSDSGLDVDNCYFWDSSGDVATDGSVDVTRRKVVQYVGYADRSDTAYGHGTHVAGTIAGCRSDNGRTEQTGLGDGIARGAKVAFFDIGYGRLSNLRIPQSISQLLNPGRNAGARIHSASWGSNSNGYGYDERGFDAYLRDNDDFMVVIAAGNSGSRANTVGAPATCKNGISVGASQNGGSHITSGMRGKDYLASFSSRGPTRDGRTKPDVVAPGAYIQSAAAGQTSCGADGLHFQVGTSMSAPVVSGTAALVRQYFRAGFYPSGRRNNADGLDPSGQLVKAVLLNGAQSLAGDQSGWGVRQVKPYDDNQNFGLVSLIHSLPLEGENTIKARVVDRKNIRAGERDTIVIEIDKTRGCTAAELSVTLCYADKAAFPNCRLCLLNDLDLYLTKEGDSRTFHANGRESRDTTNNAERVRVPASDGDRFTVFVEATNLEESSQNYALIVTGCIADAESSGETIQTPSPVPVPPAPVPAPVRAPVAAPVPVPVEKPTKKPSGNNEGDSSSTEQSTIDTTLSGQTIWDGNMFDIYVKRDIVISSMAIHTDSTSTISVEVWTKPGTLLGSQYRWGRWRQIASASVVGSGKGQLTKIPEEAFAGGGISVRKGETHALYVTLDTQNMIMSEGIAFGRDFADGDDLVIKQGLANSHLFNDIFYPYLWNGAISYQSDEYSIATLLDGNTNYVYFGNMFEVDATVDISIYELEIHTSSTMTVGVSVLTKVGTYEGFEMDRSAWTQVASGTILGRGAGFRTPISKELFDGDVFVPAGSTQAFHVELSADALRYSPGSQRFANDDVTVRTGAAVGQDGVYAPRTWNGVIRYRK